MRAWWDKARKEDVVALCAVLAVIACVIVWGNATRATYGQGWRDGYKKGFQRGVESVEGR